MGALDGLRVLELSRFRAMAWVGVVLADHGADVLRIPCGAVPMAPWYDRGRPFVQVDRTSEAGRATIQALADRADVVLDDLPPEAWRPELSPATIRVRLPALHGTDTPGFDGPAAASAAIFEPPLVGAPVYTPLAIPTVIAGLYALNGVVAALLARLRDGRGQEVRVALDDACVSTLELNALFTVQAPTRWSPVRWAASPFLRAWPCADGQYLYVHAGMAAHGARLLEVLGDAVPEMRDRLQMSEATARDPSAVATPAEARRLLRAMGYAFASREASDWQERLSQAGLCAVVIHTVEGWLEHPHPNAAGHLVDRSLEGRMVRQPGVHVVLADTPGKAGGARPAVDPAEAWPGEGAWRAEAKAAAGDAPNTAPPLEGIRVLDVTQVIAGPTAARTLAELGADVLRIENPRLEAAWAEPFHVAFNPGKRSAALDLSIPAGRDRLRALLADWRPDVVVENFRLGVADRLGLGGFRQASPQAIVAHMTAYGATGPWAGRPGWEQTAQACTGMQADRGGEGPPDLLPLPVNDFATGLSGALGILLALLHRARTGHPQDVSTSLAATAMHLQGPYAWRDGEDAPEHPTGAARGWGPRCRFVTLGDGEAFLAFAPGALDGVEGLDGLDPEKPAALDRVLRTAPWTTWVARLEGRDATLARRGRTKAVLTDPARRERGLVHRHGVEGIGAVTTTGSALRLSRTAGVGLAAARPRGGDPVDDGAVVDLPAAPHTERSWLLWVLEQARWALLLRAGL